MTLVIKIDACLWKLWVLFTPWPQVNTNSLDPCLGLAIASCWLVTKQKLDTRQDQIAYRHDCSLLLNLLSSNKTVDDKVDRAVEHEHEVVDVGDGVHPLGVVRAQP